MKKWRAVIVATILLFAFSLGAFAQGGAPQGSGVSHFSVNASAVGFTGTNSASAATIAGGSVNLTKRVALGYQQIIIPNESATFYFGEGQYTIPIDSLVGKKLGSHFVFNASKYSVTFFGGMGVVRQSGAVTSSVTDPVTGAVTTSSAPWQVQRVAETLGAGLNYVADSHITVQIVSGQWIHGGLQGAPPNQFVATPNTASIATGLKVTF